MFGGSTMKRKVLKNKIVKIVTAICLSASVVACGIPTVLNAAPNNKEAKAATNSKELKLWYNQSAQNTETSVNGATKWEAATLPIGNGKIGANVYGEVGNEHLTVNEETLWSGGRGSVNNYDGGNPDPKEAKKAYNALADYYVNGKSLPWGISMESLKGDTRNTSGYDDGYQPLGDLYVKFGHRGESNYTRDLNLNAGTANVKYDAGKETYTRKYFVNHDYNTLVGRFETVGKGKISPEISFTSKQNNTVETSISGNKGYIHVSGKVQNNGLIHDTWICVEQTGGSISKTNNTINVKNADDVTVYLTTATDYKNQFKSGATEYYYRTGESANKLSTRVKNVLDKAVTAGYNTVKDDHITDYQNLYNRVSLDLGQNSTKATDTLLNDYKSGYASEPEKRYLEALMYQYGRYLLISGSREDSQIPTTLQGIWNDTLKTDWNSDIHTNINLEMNYWLAGNCNLPECALPLVDYMSKLKEPGGKTVECYTGCTNGIMAHTQNTPFGYTSPGWEIKTWGWSPAAATWLMQNCYDYYEYSNDIDTLRNTIYPMMKDQVLMYQELLKDKDGRKVMPIALSPEIGPVTSGNTFEQSIIWQLYSDTIEAAEILGETVPQEWRNTFELLKPIEIGNSGQVKEWYNETSINSVVNTSDHRHLSNLLGLFPGNLFDTPDKIDAAKVSLNNKNFGKVGATGKNPEGGWTYAQMINSWARVGDSKNAYFCIEQMLKTRFFENLWDYHNAAIYQIDGNYGYSAGIAEMLLQSNYGYINMLPALPSQWNTGSVKGLLAENHVTVDMDWTNGELTKATLTPAKTGTCKVKNPYAGSSIKIADAQGNAVTFTDEKGICSFEATANEKYTITKDMGQTPEPNPEPNPEKPLNVEATQNQDGHVTLNWQAEEGVTYTIYRKKISK